MPPNGFGCFLQGRGTRGSVSSVPGSGNRKPFSKYGVSGNNLNLLLMLVEPIPLTHCINCIGGPLLRLWLCPRPARSTQTWLLPAHLLWPPMYNVWSEQRFDPLDSQCKWRRIKACSPLPGATLEAASYSQCRTEINRYCDSLMSNHEIFFRDGRGRVLEEWVDECRPISDIEERSKWLGPISKLQILGDWPRSERWLSSWSKRRPAVRCNWARPIENVLQHNVDSRRMDDRLAEKPLPPL